MRSVVLKTSTRCARCSLAPRWCICEVQCDIVCPLEIDVLIHHREQFRPSSTGNLVQRVIPASRQHVWRRERHLTAADLRIADRELWVLHPHGESAPAGVPAEGVQVVLLDGSWRETSAMAQEVAGWGRLVNLPIAGDGRYWLRVQADAGRFSTAEALLFLLNMFGLTAARDALRLQFELHVYAHLRARGHKAAAEDFLRSSPLCSAFPAFLARLNTPRPR